MRARGNFKGEAPLLAIFAILLLAACSGGLAGGGDATETGNALAGNLVLENGGAAAGARVALVPEDWNPALGRALPDSFQDTADSRGRYGFPKAAPGRYNVQAVHPTTGRRILIQGIAIAADTVKMGQDTVKVPGSLSFLRPDWAPKEGGICYLPGTTWMVRLERARRDGARFLLDSLAPGMPYQVRYSPDADTASYLMAEDPVIRSGQTTALHPFAAWAYSARIVVNTSAAGVAIAGDVRDFPLLVRLNAPTFDFTQAQADGRDLRFAKPEGTTLPFVVEAWERGTVLAWVRMDTLKAGESGQHLTVHWGNPQASFPTGMPPVFDTAAGFAGVWHLGEEAADTVANGLYKDATPAGNHGNDRIVSTGNAGVVGPGHAFEKGDYIRVPRAPSVRLADGFTLSTWFRSQLQPGGKGGEMISVGDNYGLRLAEDGTLHVFFWPDTVPAASQRPWYTLGSQGFDFLDGNWHLAQGTFDGTYLRLYLDGKELAALAVPGPVDFKYPINVTLGRHGNGQAGFDYNGDMDEVQIHAGARNADWHKLSFENQKPGSGFPALAPP